jgi:arginyl-tRNA synthetase
MPPDKQTTKTQPPQQYATQLVTDACGQALKLNMPPAAEVTRTDPQFGDFASNVAMQLKDQLSRPPREIAGEVAAQLTKSDDIGSAEAAGPGFINLTFTDQYWLSVAERLPALVQPQPKTKDKVQVEFISANPTGPLTLGNARGGFVGDVLSNVLQTQGHYVIREYYFNDAGTQIDTLIRSVQHYAGEVEEEPQYRGAYVKELAEHYRQWRDGQESGEGVDLGSLLTSHVFEKYISPALDKMGIPSGDNQANGGGQTLAYTNESQLGEEYDSAITEFGQELIYQQEGATWLRLSMLEADERDRVLMKSNGDRTYLANDIAYHYDIFRNRDFDRAIKIWGADHTGQVPSLRLVANHLFPEKQLEFVIIQWVRLIKDGEEVKLSKRAGTYVTVDELIDRVGADVARWFMLTRSNDTHMDFDLDLAEEESRKNPYWYVMYAYVRARAIQRQAAERGMEAAAELTALNPGERAIVQKLSRLPELLHQIEHSYEVHHLTFYGHELAKLFHDWYETVPVVDSPAEEAAQKLLFLQRFTTVMEFYFAILGIQPQEQM